MIIAQLAEKAGIYLMASTNPRMVVGTVPIEVSNIVTADTKAAATKVSMRVIFSPRILKQCWFFTFDKNVTSYLNFLPAQSDCGFHQ